MGARVAGGLTGPLEAAYYTQPFAMVQRKPVNCVHTKKKPDPATRRP